MDHPPPSLRRSWPIAAFLLGLAGIVGAAPTTDAPGGNGTGGAALPVAVPDLGDEARNVPQTIRQLLELQGAPPPIEGATDPQRAKSSSAASAPRPVLPGFEMPSGDTSPSAPAAVSPRAAAASAGRVDWRVGMTGGFGNTSLLPTMPSIEGGHATQRHARPGAEEEMDAIKALLPEKLFAWVREYREWLLAGGTLILMLLGLSAALASQARR